MHIYPWYISDITSAKEMKAVFGEGIKRIFISIEKVFYGDTMIWILIATLENYF